MRRLALAGFTVGSVVLVASFQNCAKSTNSAVTGSSVTASETDENGNKDGHVCLLNGVTHKAGSVVNAYIAEEIKFTVPLKEPDPKAVFCNAQSNRREITCLSTGEWSGEGFGSCRNIFELPSRSVAFHPTVDDHVIGIYLAATGRFPEGEGLAYWKDTYLSGKWDVQTLSENLSRGAEVNKEYPYASTLSDNDFIDAHFEKTYRFKADTGGRNYWVAKLSLLSRYQIHGVINDVLMSYDNESTSGLTAEVKSQATMRYWAFHNRRLAAKYYLAKFPNKAVKLGDAHYLKLKELFTTVSEKPDDLAAAYRAIDALQ